MSSLEELKTNFASKEEIRQLAKAMATTSTANDMITVDMILNCRRKYYKDHFCLFGAEWFS